MDENTESAVPAPIELEKTIVLRKPVRLGKDKDQQLVYSELTMREPTADEIDRFLGRNDPGKPMSAMYFLISAVSGVPEPAVRKIGMLDIKEAMKFLIPFVSLDDIFPETGGKSSRI